MSSFVTREYKFDNSSDVAAAVPSPSTMTPPANNNKEQHKMAIRSFKKLIKPILRLIKKKQLLKKTLAEIQQQNAYNTSLDDMRKDPAINDDNLANEALEKRIYTEIRQCPQNAAVIVQQDQKHCIVPVHPEQKFIPVHFARTSNGTFFWTSLDANSTRQQELQMRAQYDRWGQA